MANYDFSTLNDKDLEDLMCELLSKELSLRLQKFKSGKDGGVDLRHSTASSNNAIVVQVKHYLRSGYKALLSELKREVLKLARLNVKRYIVATSVPLSPQNKDEIKQIFDPYILSTSDIFGKDDINSLLTKYHDIERGNYKLWLSSVSVMQTVLHNAVHGRSKFEESRIRKNLCRYVITKDYNRALNILRKDKVLLISGTPGIGKTSLANLITYYVLSKDFQLVYIDNIREAEDLFISDQSSKQLFYFDDFLGSNYLDIVQGNKGRSIVSFVDRIKESKNKFLILTTRSTILNQAKATDEQIYHSGIASNKYEIVIDNYSNWDKAKILYNHLYYSDIERCLIDIIFENKRYWNIIEHKNYNPRIIEFFSKGKNCGTELTPLSYYQFVMDSLDHPSLIWEKAIDNQLNVEEVLLLHTLFSFGQTQVSRSDLELAYDRRIEYEIKNNGFKKGLNIFNKAFSNLLDGYITNAVVTKNYSYVDFINPSLRDYLLSYFNGNKNETRRLLESVRYVRQITMTFSFSQAQNRVYLDNNNSKSIIKLVDNIDFSFTNYDSEVIHLTKYYTHILNDDNAHWLAPIIINRLKGVNFNTSQYINSQSLLYVIFKMIDYNHFSSFLEEHKFDLVQLLTKVICNLDEFDKLKGICAALNIDYDEPIEDVEMWNELKIDAVNRVYKYEADKIWEEEIFNICDEETTDSVQQLIYNKFEEVSITLMPIGHESLIIDYNPIEDVDIDDLIRENNIAEYESDRFEDYDFEDYAESEESRIDDLFSV